MNTRPNIETGPAAGDIGDSQKLVDVWLLGHRFRLLSALANCTIAEIHSPAHTPGPALYRQRKAIQFVTVIEGRLQLRIGDQSENLGPGDSRTIESSTPRSFENISNSECIWVSVWSPAGFRKFIDHIGVPVSDANGRARSLNEQRFIEFVSEHPEYGLHLTHRSFTKAQQTPRDIFLGSFERCQADSPDFFVQFYETFVSSSEEIKRIFETVDFEAQSRMISRSLYIAAQAVSGDRDAIRELNRVAKIHDKAHLNVRPELYVYWQTSLIATAKKHDGEWSPTIEAAWSQILEVVISRMVKCYEGAC